MKKARRRLGPSDRLLSVRRIDQSDILAAVFTDALSCDIGFAQSTLSTSPEPWSRLELRRNCFRCRNRFPERDLPAEYSRSEKELFRRHSQELRQSRRIYSNPATISWPTGCVASNGPSSENGRYESSLGRPSRKGRRGYDKFRTIPARPRISRGVTLSSRSGFS